MILGKKVRLHPNREQEQRLWASVGTSRYIYNWTLARQHENYQSGGKFISDNDLRKEITQLKKGELSWLNNVSNNVAKQAVKDACDSYKRFFKGLSKPPRFKSRKKSKPSFYNDNCKLKIGEYSALIEKVGWMRTNEQIPMGVKYSNPRISFDGKYWYLSVGIETEYPEVKLTGESIGIDLGISDLAIVSNLDKPVKNLNKTAKIKKIKKKLRRLQRKVSKKYEMNKEGRTLVKTCNIIKLEKQIRLIHRKLSNLRANHIHQTTNTIVKTKPSRVVMEDLNVTGMMKNRHLSKAIQEQGFHEFRRQIQYKCEFCGIEFVLADRFFPSSKTCSECGSVKEKLSLSERTYVCKECGCVLDRDKNASINLSRYGLAI